MAPAWQSVFSRFCFNIWLNNLGDLNIHTLLTMLIHSKRGLKILFPYRLFLWNTWNQKNKQYAPLLVYCQPVYLTYMQSTSWETLDWKKHKLETIARTNINNLRYADDTTLMAESEEELKSLLMKVKVERGKVGLKLDIQKTKIMASGPTTSWEIDGETLETVSDFIFGGSKITAHGWLQPWN